MENKAQKQNHPGKCTRCGRVLKRVFEIAGAPYGPVCVRKMGYAIVSETKVRRIGEHKEIPDTAQQTFFDGPTPSVDYVGTIVGNDDDRWVLVTRDGTTRNLDPRFDLANHSPTGFCWGYGGSGPAQLALAILADYLRDDERALSLYQDFKFKVIADLDMNAGFTLTSQQIENAITAICVNRAQRS